jgi:predicted dehydrogenase
VIRLTGLYPQTRLMVGQSSRFFGPMQAQRKAFESGKLGPLTFAETFYVHDMRWFYGNRPWAREGGFDLLFACCSHPVDLIRWYMGDVAEVSAYADRSLVAEQANFSGSDTFIINLKFESGRIGRVLGYYGLEHIHQNRAWIEVALYGVKGTFIAHYPQLQSLQKYTGEHEKLETYFEDIYHYFQFEGINTPVNLPITWNTLPVAWSRGKPPSRTRWMGSKPLPPWRQSGIRLKAISR